MYLRDVNYQSLQSKLSEIQESIDCISNIKNISDVYEHKYRLLNEKYENLIKRNKKN